MPPLILSSLSALSHFPLIIPFLESLPLPNLPFKYPCYRILHPRVISPRQPPSMVLEVYVLARTTFKIPKIQSRDTSPADRSLRFLAMIGIGLMARDILPRLSNKSTAFLFYFAISFPAEHLWNYSRC